MNPHTITPASYLFSQLSAIRKAKVNDETPKPKARTHAITFNLYTTYRTQLTRQPWTRTSTLARLIGCNQNTATQTLRILYHHYAVVIRRISREGNGHEFEWQWVEPETLPTFAEFGRGAKK